jgi:hypothetical protein
MSEHDLQQIDRISGMLKWLLSGMGAMLLSAFGVGVWVNQQQAEIRNLVEADKRSVVDIAEVRGTIKAQNDVLTSLKQESALQSRDIGYIRTSVEKIERNLEPRRPTN